MSENGFTNKEILERLERKVDKVLDDHELRIRSNENAIFRIKGALIFVTVVLPTAAGLLLAFIH